MTIAVCKKRLLKYSTLLGVGLVFCVGTVFCVAEQEQGREKNSGEVPS